jgi:hypothetical protein
MPPSSLPPFNTFADEGAAVGRMLAGYSNLEVGLFHCVQVAIRDFDTAFKAMFSVRGESRRIDTAERLGLPAYVPHGLDTDFLAAVAAMRHCLLVRNQYAHWTFWDDNSGALAFANLEDLAKVTAPLSDLGALGVFHIDAALVQAQETFFVYVDRYLAWVNYEGRFLSGLINRSLPNKPTPLPFPALRL